MKLSIITVTRNDLPGLRQTMQSVVAQSKRDFEYIVIDGGSRDGSRELLAESDDVDLWVSERDGGIYDAMNKAIARASGEYLLFVNSGDRLYETDTIEKIGPFLDSTSIVYGNLKIEDSTTTRDGFMPPTIDLRQMMKDTLWHPVAFLKSELFRQYGLYDTRYRICGDYDFFFNVLIDKKVTQRHIDQFISIFALNGISSKPENQAVILEEKRRAQRKWLSQGEIDRFWKREKRRQVLRRGRRLLSRRSG